MFPAHGDPAREARVLRDRMAAAEDALDALQAGGDTGCSPALVVQTIAISAYPTAAQSVYAANPCLVDGTETEGSAATFVADGDTVVYFFNAGSQIPPLSTQLLVHGTGGRWVAYYNG